MICSYIELIRLVSHPGEPHICLDDPPVRNAALLPRCSHTVRYINAYLNSKQSRTCQTCLTFKCQWTSHQPWECRVMNYAPFTKIPVYSWKMSIELLGRAELGMSSKVQVVTLSWDGLLNLRWHSMEADLSHDTMVCAFIPTWGWQKQPTEANMLGNASYLP